MSEYYTITIGREFGSGGREIGKKVATQLGIKCYDKELIQEVAKESNLTPEFLESVDEHAPGFFSSHHVMDVGISDIQSPSIKAYIAQFDTIKKISDRENCIIIGRCADFVLAEKTKLLNLFIYANTDTRIERLCGYEGFSEKEAKSQMLKFDRKRAQYYEYYTDKKWGARRSYDLCLNTSKLTIDGCVDLIVYMVNKKFK